MLAPHRGKKARSSLDVAPPSESNAPAIVLPSSTELFYFYIQIFEQCSKLFVGKPLYDLANLQKRWLRIFAGERYHKPSFLNLIINIVNKEDVLVQNLKRSAIYIMIVDHTAYSLPIGLATKLVVRLTLATM